MVIIVNIDYLFQTDYNPHMKTRLQTIPSRIPLFSASLVLSTVTAVPAASVFINENRAAVAAGAAVAGAKLRASNNAWDQALSNGIGYQAANSRRRNAASSFTAPAGRDFTFTFEHRAGEGFIFTVIRPGGPTDRISWGTFSNAPGGTVVATLGGLAPTATFDALEFEARATLANSRITYSNLTFTSADLTTASGGFQNGTLTPTTVIGANPAGVATQELLADVNLADYSWTFSGNINLTRGAGNGGAENIRFTVTPRNVNNPAVIPEPVVSSAVLIGLALAAGRRGRA